HWQRRKRPATGPMSAPADAYENVSMKLVLVLKDHLPRPRPFFMSKTHSDIGLIGLAVMGQNLALNIADHAFRISVYNRTVEKTEKFVAENPDTPGGLVGSSSLKEFVQSLAVPRKIIILVQAGKATDAVIDGLVPLLDKNDIIIDGGNALWTDTIRREKSLKEQGLRFIGSGVSGGEEGARFGPSL